MDFDALRPAVDFVIAKASEGRGFTDQQFQYNWIEAKRVGLVRGAYHYARPDFGNTAEDEAAYFLSVLGPLEGTEIIWLDYELVAWGGDVVGWCWTWLRYIQAMTGIVPFIYLNRSLVKAHDWTRVIVAGYPLVLAAYDGDPNTTPDTPWPKVTMKQWTSSGQLPGISTFVDLDSWFVEDDMTPDQVRQIIADYLANIYGPALESELVQRLTDTQNAAVAAAVSESIKAVAAKLAQ